MGYGVLEAGRVPGGEQRLRIRARLRRRARPGEVDIDYPVGASDMRGSPASGGGRGAVADLLQLLWHAAIVVTAGS
jgi:hypothetical protein